MTLDDLKKMYKRELESCYPPEEIDSFLKLLIEERLGLSRAQVALAPTLTLEKIDEQFFLNVLRELSLERPIQYILEKTQFYGLEFKLNEQVLIPRPETEELVDWILQKLAQQHKTKDSLTLVDIGTGSGCIAIALAKHLPHAKVYALDISPEALKLAKENARRNQVEIEFIRADILESTQIASKEDTPLKFDVIVSNPPYVLEDEKQEIKANVLNYEPHLALFVNDSNPLLFYNKIADIASGQLKTKGCLFFEINQYLGQETLNLLHDKGFEEATLRKDLQQNDRMILASKLKT